MILNLVILDFQGKLSQIVYQSETVLSKASALIKGIRHLEIPITWVEQTPEKLGQTTPEIAECLSGLSPMAKCTFSAYATEEIAQKIQSQPAQASLTNRNRDPYLHLANHRGSDSSRLWSFCPLWCSLLTYFGKQTNRPSDDRTSTRKAHLCRGVPCFHFWESLSTRSSEI